MSWYVMFNIVEGVLWWITAIAVLTQVPASTNQQLWGARLGALALVVFGITDWLECRHETMIPLWLWGMKVVCGVAILAARYTWRGWNRFRLADREVKFGVFCMVCVVGLIWLQRFAYRV